MSGAVAMARLALMGMAAGASLGLPTAYSLVSAHESRDATATSVPAGPANAAADGEIADVPIVEGSEDAVAKGGVTRARNGMFYADIRVEGARLRCLIDTGASALVLSSAEAARLGLHARGGYSGTIETAGGRRAATRERLGSVEIAGHRYAGVSAVLVRGGGTPCLMGQDLLARLDAIEIHGDELSLR